MMINPILNREVITIFRRGRTYFWICAYLGIIIMAVYSSWPGYYSYYYGSGQNNVFEIINASRRAAASVLYTIILLVFVLLPSYMATTFTREKEENTLASLTVTQLNISDIIYGKMQVAMFYTGYLLLITVPVFGALYNMGGFSINELLQAYLIIMGVSTATSLWAMFFSVISGSSYKAISRTYFFFFIIMLILGFVSSYSYRSGLNFIFDSAVVNPFICINTIFMGTSRYSSMSGPLYNLSKYQGQDLIFGLFYIETLKLLAFYTVVSVGFIIAIKYVYRQLEHNWI